MVQLPKEEGYGHGNNKVYGGNEVRSIMIVASLMVIVLSIAGIVASINEPQEDTYCGKEVFTTEREYTEFKQAVADDTVEVVSVQSLSSAPPIIVAFEVIVEGDSEFGYGKRETNNARRPVYIVLSCIATAVGLSMLATFAANSECVADSK